MSKTYNMLVHKLHHLKIKIMIKQANMQTFIYFESANLYITLERRESRQANM